MPSLGPGIFGNGLGLGNIGGLNIFGTPRGGGLDGTGDIGRFPTETRRERPPIDDPGTRFRDTGRGRCRQECIDAGVGPDGMAACIAICESGANFNGDTNFGGPIDSPPTDNGGGDGGGGLSDILSQLAGLGNFTQDSLLQELKSFLSNALKGPFGIDPRVIQQQRNIITGSGAQREQTALQNLKASLNTVGQVGGGREIELGRQIAADTTSSVSDQLSQLSRDDALLAQQDRDAILGNILGFGGLLGQGGAQEISKLLGISDIELRRFLGEGNLSLGNRGLDFQIALQQLLGQLGLLGLA